MLIVSIALIGYAATKVAEKVAEAWREAKENEAYGGTAARVVVAQEGSPAVGGDVLLTRADKRRLGRELERLEAQAKASAAASQVRA